MSEEKLVPRTDPLAKGSATSEGQQNKILVISGVVISTLAALATQLQNTAPESKYTAAVVAIAALLGTVWKALGFEKSRTVIKAEKLRTDAVVAAATGGAANPQMPPSSSV